MGKDYINSVTSCLEDALTDRDLVHRQTACSIVKHLALGTAGLGQEDANLHLMNLVWPVSFEVYSRHFPPLTWLDPRIDLSYLARFVELLRDFAACDWGL